MQIKNNESRNLQFFFYKKGKSGKSELDFIHVPGGATVEIDDEVYKSLTESMTEVEELREEVVQLDDENIGASVKTGKEALVIKEYYSTGKTRKVNLVKEAIKAGSLTIVERVKVGMPDIDAILTKNGVDVKGMPEDVKLALYDKLA